MKSWLTVLCVLSMILIGSGDIMGQSKKPVKKNGQPVVMGRGKPFTDSGRVLLGRGEGKKSVGNDASLNITDNDMLMEILNANLIHRKRDQAKPKLGEQSIAAALGGLFGGTSPDMRKISQEETPSTGGRRRGR